MIYHPLTPEQKPYDVRIWHCNGFKEHWHDSTELYICLKGKLTIRSEGVDYHMTQYDTLLVASNETHEIFCPQVDTYVVLISFGYSLLGNDYRLMQNVCFDSPFFNLKDGSASERIRLPLEQIIELLQAQGKNSVTVDWALRSNLYAIAAHLSEHTHFRAVSKERLLRTRQLEKLQGTLHYIKMHFREEITLADAALAAGYDASYFCKLFRSATGVTFHRYLNEYRISVACQLLTQSEAPISTVAENAGFPSQKHLNRLFRNMMGMTPTQYRKLLPYEQSYIRPL